MVARVVNVTDVLQYPPPHPSDELATVTPLVAPRFADGGPGLPPPETRSRRRVVQGSALLALAVSAAYLAWRVGFTLGHDLWIAIPLWLLELHAVVGLALFSFSLWDLDSAVAPDPVVTSDLRVAVLITTVNEPSEVLLPTIAAAVALTPSHETWVLDDGERPWVRDLASSLGAHYLARTEHHHAKAGNLDNALARLTVDLVAVLDADHVVMPGFLTHTLGYFADPRLAVVQTPQEFYNVNSFEHDRNRSWFWRERRSVSFNEQRLFYRAIQPGKNRWGAAFWCGTNAVVRTAALREVGGVAYETVTEDIHTTIRMHRRGWRTVYHNEVLAHGLAARDAAQYQSQRLRWGTGAMQLLHTEHPLTGPGLTLRQRLAYAATILGWFDAWRSLGYVLIPLAVIFTGAMPIRTSLVPFVVFFGLAFGLQRLALALLSRGYAPLGMSALFEFVRLQTTMSATLSYLRPGERQFRVTTKAGAPVRHRNDAPWLLWFLLALSGASALWLISALTGLTDFRYPNYWTVYGAALWMVINSTLLAGAIRRIRSDRFATDRRTAVRLQLRGDVYLDDNVVELLDVSMGGALVRSELEPPRDGVHRLSLGFEGTEHVVLRAEERSRQVVGDRGALVSLQFCDDQERAIGQMAVKLFGGHSSSALPRGE